MRGLQAADDVIRREAEGRELGAVENHAHRAGLSADHLCLGNVGDLADSVLDLIGHLAQLIAVVVLAPQGERQDGNVVDGPGLDERLRDALGHAIGVGVELAVDLDQRVFLRRPHQEAHDDQALPRAGDGVHVLDAGNFVHQAFDGIGDALFDFLRRGTRHGGHHVEHGDEDLRLLLARDGEYGQETQSQGRDDGDRRQLRIDEGVGQLPGDPV